MYGGILWAMRTAQKELEELNKLILWLQRNRPLGWQRKVRGLVARCHQLHGIISRGPRKER